MAEQSQPTELQDEASLPAEGLAPEAGAGDVAAEGSEPSAEAPSLSEMLERRLQEHLASLQQQLQQQWQTELQKLQAAQEYRRQVEQVLQLDDEEIGRRVKERLAALVQGTAPSTPDILAGPQPAAPRPVAPTVGPNIEELAQWAQQYPELKNPPQEDIPRLQEIVRTSTSTAQAVERLLQYVHERRLASAQQRAAELKARAASLQQQAQQQTPSLTAAAEPAQSRPRSLAEYMVEQMRKKASQ